jgi:hypothetical protein
MSVKGWQGRYTNSKEAVMAAAGVREMSSSLRASSCIVAAICVDSVGVREMQVL